MLAIRNLLNSLIEFAPGRRSVQGFHRGLLAGLRIGVSGKAPGVPGEAQRGPM